MSPRERIWDWFCCNCVNIKSHEIMLLVTFTESSRYKIKRFNR